MIEWLTIWIPLHCVDPLLNFYRSNSIYQMERPYNAILETGKIAIDTCAIGFKDADINIPVSALFHIGDIVKSKQDQSQIDSWVNQIMNEGCARITEKISVCKEGG